MTTFTRVLIDGEAQDPTTASIPLSDVGFVRGYGVFEVLRAFDGRCVRLTEHLERLDRSADMLGIRPPAHDDLRRWVSVAAGSDAEALVRIMVTAHDDPWDERSRVIVTGEPPPEQPESITLLPVPAPWHSDGAEWELRGAKTLSYANNFGAIATARSRGFTDALLLGRSGRILEGPTFSVGWVVERDDGHGDPTAVFETPPMHAGILDSITRRLAFDAAGRAGLELREVDAGLDRLAEASEVFAISTLRDAVAVSKVGEREFPIGRHTSVLREAMSGLMMEELDRDRSSLA